MKTKSLKRVFDPSIKMLTRYLNGHDMFIRPEITANIHIKSFIYSIQPLSSNMVGLKHL